MKKIVALLFMVAILVSCEEDVKFNDPGFQGRKDNYTWRADLTSAYITDGYMFVNAYKGLEAVVLRFPAPTSDITPYNPVTYTFMDREPGDEGLNDDVTATYSFQDQGVNFEYFTGIDSQLEDPGNVEVTVTEYVQAKKTISGTFHFNVKYDGTSTAIPENVNFQEGAFFHVPLPL